VSVFSVDDEEEEEQRDLTGINRKIKMDKQVGLRACLCVNH